MRTHIDIAEAACQMMKSMILATTVGVTRRVTTRRVGAMFGATNQTACGLPQVYKVTNRFIDIFTIHIQSVLTYHGRWYVPCAEGQIKSARYLATTIEAFSRLVGLVYTYSSLYRDQLLKKIE